MPTMADEVRDEARVAFQKALDTPGTAWVGYAEDAAAASAYAAGRADERAAVVADIRSFGLMFAADRYDRGEHLGACGTHGFITDGEWRDA